MLLDDGCNEVRTLAILAPDSDTYSELASVNKNEDWRRFPELEAACVTVSRRSYWRKPEAVIHFLRCLLSDESLRRLRGVWLPHRADPHEHRRDLDHARPLTELIPANMSPLACLLRDDRLETWFQPIFHAHSFSLWGYECLMRGRTQDGAIIGPERLIHWAHRQQLMFTLDCFSRKLHLHNVGRRRLADHAHIIVNFLPSTISQPEHCLDSSMEIVREHDINPARIIFKAVNSDACADHDHLGAILSLYRLQGFKVALDDLGNGPAGMVMLAALEPDLVKVGRYLVQRAPHSRSHRRMCASLIEAAHEQNKLVLANGVENSEEKSVMENLGVDLYQGYYFAPPADEPVTTPMCVPANVG